VTQLNITVLPLKEKKKNR